MIVHCRAGSRKPCKYPMLVRAMAVAAYDEATAQNRDIDYAVRIFKERMKACKRPLMSRVRQFIKGWANHHQKYNNVDDPPRPGRPSAIPDDAALKLSKMFKKGVVVTVPPTKLCLKPMKVHRYFTSVPDAIASSPQFAKLVRKYKVSPKQVLGRMRAVDPNLVRRMTDYKLPFSIEEREERMETAKQLCKEKQSRLDETIWIDCGTIWVTANSLNREVWCDRDDERVHDVQTLSNLGHNAKIKMTFIVAVSATRGPLWLEFVTGTRNIKRSQEFYQITHRRQPYKVNHQLLCNPFVGCTPKWAATT